MFYFLYRVGCKIVEEGSWIDVFVDVYIVGIKELLNEDRFLKNFYIYFGYVYKVRSIFCLVDGFFFCINYF